MAIIEMAELGFRDFVSSEYLFKKPVAHIRCIMDIVITIDIKSERHVKTVRQ